MPRKKLTSTEKHASSEPQPISEEPKPKRSRAKKTAPIQGPDQVIPAAEAEVKTARSRGRKKAAEEAAVAPPAPEKPTRPKKDTTKAAEKPKDEPARKPRAKAVATPPAAVVEAEVPAKKPRTRSKAKPKKDLPELIEIEDMPVVTFRPRQAKPDSGKVAQGAAAPVAQEPEAYGGEDGLVVLEWRSRRETPSKTSPAEASEESDLTPRKSRRRRRKEFQDAEITAAGIEMPSPQDEVSDPVPEIPKVPEKPPITIPHDAPQVVLRNGIPTLVRDHRVYPPIMFFGSPSDERRAATVLEELRMAAEGGVHLHSFLVDLEVDTRSVDSSIQFAGYMLKRAVEIDPEAQVLFRVVFQPARGWEDRFPNARYKTEDGVTADPSICDDAYWGEAAKCLETFASQLRNLALRDHILGVHLDRGEWFLAEGQGYDTSKSAQAKFREWARLRYLGDEVTLRASWFDGSVRFDTIDIPRYQREGSEGERFIRSSRKQRRYVDYHLFLSDATVSRIADLAHAAKAASDGYFLVGASYGYTFEWSHPSSGHLALGKLLRTQEIDFIAGPPSYRNREPGGAAPFPGPIDSYSLNGKLYISEEDYKTSLSFGHEPDDFNPPLKTPQALESVHWRGAGAALSHASGVCWMDSWGNGWLKTSSVWSRAASVREALTDRMDAPLTDPDVAVFVDERALAYLVDPDAFTLLVQNVRESVLRAGVSAGFYLLSDLAHREKFPESKLYLFLNAWDIRPDLRAAIKSRLQRDGKVLFWLYSAGLFDAGRDSLERAREVTGIALKPQPYHSRSGTTLLNRRHPLSESFPDKSLIGGTQLEPSYFAIPENATVLGEYSQTGLPSFVVKEFNEGDSGTHWTSVFLGEPLVNPALIRALAHMAGAHVWNFHEDVVHVRPPFCIVHCTGAGPRAITLPSKCSAYDPLTDQWTAVDSTHLRFNAVDGATYLFLVGPKEELEHFLNRDRSQTLKVDRLPPRELNIRVDTSQFDVPIMKLGDWIEGGDSDEVADEWFLRPQALMEEPVETATETEAVGRRRRRRRSGDRNDSRQERSTEAPPERTEVFEAEDLGMQVVFRKRD